MTVEQDGATNIKKDFKRTGIQYTTSANDSIQPGISLVIYECSGSDCVLSVPECNASQDGRQITIKNLNGGKVVEFTPLLGTVDGSTEFNINNGYKTATFMCAFSASGLNMWLSTAKI